MTLQSASGPRRKSRRARLKTSRTCSLSDSKTWTNYLQLQAYGLSQGNRQQRCQQRRLTERDPDLLGKNKLGPERYFLGKEAPVQMKFLPLGFSRSTSWPAWVAADISSQPQQDSYIGTLAKSSCLAEGQSQSSISASTVSIQAHGTSHASWPCRAEGPEALSFGVAYVSTEDFLCPQAGQEVDDAIVDTEESPLHVPASCFHASVLWALDLGAAAELTSTLRTSMLRKMGFSKIRCLSAVMTCCAHRRQGNRVCGATGSHAAPG